MSDKIIGDRYQVIRLLGKKPGWRTVLCRDIQSQQLVVIKLLAWDEDFEWQSLKLFEREAEVLQSISHPAIPSYLNYFEINQPHLKGFALVQNYIEAASLEEHLKSGRTFSIEEVKQLAKSLLDIITYLHSQKPQIIHRDIKPSNILLTNRSGNNIGNIYLVDFGSVKSLAASTNGTITVVGTYGYMSPEHFGGKVVPTSDLYSLGATLIYLVTGMHPANLPQKDGRIQFEQLINCPLSFVSWLKRMVEPFPEWRFSSAKIALQELKQTSSSINYLGNKDYIKNKSRTTKNVMEAFGSQVSLKQDKNRLEIAINPLKMGKSQGELIFFIRKYFAHAIILSSMVLTVIILPIFISGLLKYSILIFPIQLALILLKLITDKYSY
ncbi:MAG: serine/threonine-protein kinase [Cyanobacteria bacterium P01_D01_bin.50]